MTMNSTFSRLLLTAGLLGAAASYAHEADAQSCGSFEKICFDACIPDSATCCEDTPTGATYCNSETPICCPDDTCASQSCGSSSGSGGGETCDFDQALLDETCGDLGCGCADDCSSDSECNSGCCSAGYCVHSCVCDGQGSVDFGCDGGGSGSGSGISCDFDQAALDETCGDLDCGCADDCSSDSECNSGCCSGGYCVHSCICEGLGSVQFGCGSSSGSGSGSGSPSSGSGFSDPDEDTDTVYSCGVDQSPGMFGSLESRMSLLLFAAAGLVLRRTGKRKPKPKS